MFDGLIGLRTAQPPSSSSSSSSTMSFSVSKLSQELVVPSAPTPSGTLPLSWLDGYPTQRALIESLHVFKYGDAPANSIKTALAKALVPYYPLAGRLVESDQAELEVDCTGDGVWFMEASTNCSLEDVNYLEHPFIIAKDELLPHPQPKMDIVEETLLLFMTQVTRFTCGGFVVGFRFSHAISDGPGAAQFVNAVADFSRGLSRPTTTPIWRRELVPKPPKFTHAPPNPTPHPDFTLQYFIMDITLEYITHMKSQYISQMGHRCSSFEVLIAKAWQSRVQSIGFDPEDDVHLVFAMNTRPLLKQVFNNEGGYYGNSYYLMKITATSEKIAKGTVSEVVKLITDAKKRLPGEFASFTRGELKEDPYSITTAYETLLVSDWTWLGFNDVDYGWGPPVHVVPLTNSDYVATCILVKPSAPKQGARLMTQCVKKEHFAGFLDRMMSLE